MDDFAQVPNPEEDLKHAHMLLAQMSPEDLLKATYALEEIVEDSPRFQEKMRKRITEAKNSGYVTTEQLLSELGFAKEDFPGLFEDVPATKNEAA